MFVIRGSVRAAAGYISCVCTFGTCRLQVGGVRRLTEALSRHSNNRSLATAADDEGACQMSAEVVSQLLRTLATLCCVEESLVQLHEVRRMHAS